MIIDTHCHLHFDAFDADREAVIQRARDAGVRYMITVGTDTKTNQAAFDLAQKYDFIRSTVGFHPHHAAELTEENLSRLELEMASLRPAAIGEIGLDYYKNPVPSETQKKIFVRMLHLAAREKLPAIIHSREAWRDTLEILKSEVNGKIKAVLHCFSYDEVALREALAMGLWVSFTCNLTFKHAGALLAVAKKVPLERLMLETDAPYLAPQSVRGKRNEPAYLTELVRLLSETIGVSPETLAEQTSRNALQFFSLEKKAAP